MSSGKKQIIKDTTGFIDKLVEALSTGGDVQLTHFGRFRVVPVKGRKVYSFKERTMRPVPEYKIVMFTPSKGLREMLNKK